MIPHWYIWQESYNLDGQTIAQSYQVMSNLFYQHRYELHIVDGVIFFHNRIVVPIGLRRQFLNKLHDSHLGIAKTKLMARMLVYWPKME